MERAFGLIDGFKSKDEKLEEECEKFISIYKPESKYVPHIKNYLKAYVSNEYFRNEINNKRFLREYAGFTMAELYGVSVSAINQHIKKLTEDNEINDSAIKQYLITASDGKNYNATQYNLQAIISVGFKIKNERAVQFRKWARQIVKDYTIQGWTMDTERLDSSFPPTSILWE